MKPLQCPQASEACARARRGHLARAAHFSRQGLRRSGEAAGSGGPGAGGQTPEHAVPTAHCFTSSVNAATRFLCFVDVTSAALPLPLRSESSTALIL